MKSRTKSGLAKERKRKREKRQRWRKREERRCREMGQVEVKNFVAEPPAEPVVKGVPRFFARLFRRNGGC